MKIRSKIIIILACICLLSTPIATFVFEHILNIITTDMYNMIRVSDLAWSIRSACFILAMYIIFEKEN